MSAPTYETLVDIFEHSIREFGPRELFGAKKDGRWSWTTYETFGKYVEDFRGGLASLGVGRGDKVAVIADNRVEWAVIAYSCYGLGAAMVPMYEAQHDKDWEFIVRDCEAKVLFVATKAILEKAKRFLTDVPSLKEIVCLEEVAGNGSHVSSYATLMLSGQKVPSIHPQRDDVATLIYARFKSVMTQTPTALQLIPAAIESGDAQPSQVYEYEPDENEVLAELLPKNISVQIFSALLENVAGEFGAKMSAMDGATRNAGEMIGKLTLLYNRTRQ